MTFCRTARNQGPDHHHTATSIQRVLRRHRQIQSINVTLSMEGLVFRMDQQDGCRSSAHPGPAGLSSSGWFWCGLIPRMSSPLHQKQKHRLQKNQVNTRKRCSSSQPAEGDKDQSVCRPGSKVIFEENKSRTMRQKITAHSDLKARARKLTHFQLKCYFFPSFR